MLVNTTPHEITVFDEKENILMILAAAQEPLRLIETRNLAFHVDGIPVFETKFEEPKFLPEEKEGCFYIVPQFIKEFYTNRKDFLAPDQLVRKDGVIKGCKAFRV